MGRGHAPGLAEPLGWTQSGPEAGASQRNDDTPDERHSTERGHASDAAQTPVSPHCGTETGVQAPDGDAQGSDQLPVQGAHGQTNGEQKMGRGGASGPAAPDPGGSQRVDGVQGGVQATPQGVPRQQSGEQHTGRGHASVPEPDPGSVATILASLADNEDNDDINMLEEVSPKTSVGMSLGDVHEHMQRRLHDLLTLRETLSEMIVCNPAKSSLGVGGSYEA